MAMFCLLLAVAAFVLAGGPQLCRCDRPYLGSELYRTAPNGNGLEESIWSVISREPASDRILAVDTGARGLRRDDRMNLIPVTKLPLAAAAAASTRELMALESLLNRYRKFMVDKFARFDDVCSLLLYGDEDGDTTVPAVAFDSVNDSAEISLGKAIEGDRTDDTDGSGREKTPAPVRKDDLLTSTMKLSHPFGESCSKSARQFYRCLAVGVSDLQLMGLLQEYLQSSCYRDPLANSNAPQKRDAPRYVSKQKFHSWGGKRNNAQVFYPWGGKRNLVRPHKQPKVVIRNPFHSWGGKRSDASLNDEETLRVTQ